MTGCTKKLVLKRQCGTAKWNVEAGRVSGKTNLAQSVNNYLDVLQQKVYVHRKYLVQNDHPVSEENIKMLLQGREIMVPKHMVLMRIHNCHDEATIRGTADLILTVDIYAQRLRLCEVWEIELSLFACP